MSSESQNPKNCDREMILGGPVSNLTVLDFFASRAMEGMFASGGHKAVAAAIEVEQQRHEMGLTPSQIGHAAEERIASMAYAMALAMVRERQIRIGK